MKPSARGYTQVLLIGFDSKIITALSIPPFDTLPEVILLGARSFLHTDGVAYREVTSYAVPFFEDGDEG